MKDPYEAVLVDLRSKRRQIDAAIAALEAIQLGQNASQSRKLSAPRVSRDMREPRLPNTEGSMSKLSIAEAAVRIMRTRGRPMNNDELVVEVQNLGIVMRSKDDRNTMGALIRRRAEQVGDIVKASRGVWTLAEWSEDSGLQPGASFLPANSELQDRDGPTNHSEKRDVP